MIILQIIRVLDLRIKPPRPVVFDIPDILFRLVHLKKLDENANRDILLTVKPERNVIRVA